MSALMALVNNPVKEIFYGKSKKKKQLIFSQFFFISRKSNVKTFLKLIINQYSKGTR